MMHVRDPRPAEELQIAELQRRLTVYNEAQFDEDYDQANRDYWRESIVNTSAYATVGITANQGLFGHGSSVIVAR